MCPYNNQHWLPIDFELPTMTKHQWQPSSAALALLAAALPAGTDIACVRIAGRSGGGKVECRLCGTGRAVERVALPYVFKYLVTELTAMNIKLSLNIE